MITRILAYLNGFPLFHLEIALPYFQVRTSLWRRVWNGSIVEYAVFEVRLWKWRFEFSIYEPMRRLIERKRNNGGV